MYTEGQNNSARSPTRGPGVENDAAGRNEAAVRGVCLRIPHQEIQQADTRGPRSLTSYTVSSFPSVPSGSLDRELSAGVDAA
jgi:hypothetical protein